MKKAPLLLVLFLYAMGDACPYPALLLPAGAKVTKTPRSRTKERNEPYVLLSAQ